MKLMFAAILLAPLPLLANETPEDFLDRAPSFVETCGHAVTVKEPNEDEGAALLACAAFVTGIGHAISVASTYQVDGQPVCTQPATPRTVIGRSVALHAANPEQFAQSTSAQLVLASYMAANPCPE
jgi:hypothetical protein